MTLKVDLSKTSNNMIHSDLLHMVSAAMSLWLEVRPTYLVLQVILIKEDLVEVSDSICQWGINSRQIKKPKVREISFGNKRESKRLTL